MPAGGYSAPQNTANLPKQASSPKTPAKACVGADVQMSLAIRRDPAEIRTTVNVRSSDVLALNISLDDAEIDKLVESQTIRP